MITSEYKYPEWKTQTIHFVDNVNELKKIEYKFIKRDKKVSIQDSNYLFQYLITHTFSSLHLLEIFWFPPKYSYPCVSYQSG